MEKKIYRLRKVVNTVNEESSDVKKAYEDFFKMKLKKYEVKSPADLSEADKKKFFEEVDKEWEKYKKEKGL